MDRKAKARAVAANVHEAVNNKRQQRGLSRLEGDGQLASIAESYAREMAMGGEVTHYADGSTPAQRASSYRGVAENANCMGNLSRSPSDIASHCVNEWMASAGHRENIHRARFKISGVGCWIRGGRIYISHKFARGVSPTGTVVARLKSLL